MPTDHKVIKYSVHPTMHLARDNCNCLFTEQCDTPIDSKFCDLFFLSVYGIKAASNSDLLIRSTQLKLRCRSLAVCTRDGKLGFINTQDIQNKNGENR